MLHERTVLSSVFDGMPVVERLSERCVRRLSDGLAARISLIVQ
jgi:hypothetical protein